MIPRTNLKSDEILSASQARKSIRDKGYSFRRAALALGLSYSHVSKVLSGIHHSETLLRRIDALPPSDVPFMCSGFAARKHHRAK